jgi:solute carrier family 25 (mitochondrial carnitine/acylcarnitine transporter), member 20/29
MFNDRKKVSMSDYIGGFVSGIAQTLSGHPLDTIKVWSQDRIIRKRTIRNLYQGVKYPLMTTSLITSFNFGITQYYYQQNKSYLLSGFYGGFLSGIIMTPIEYLKINSQINSQIKEKCQVNLASKKIGWISTITRESLGFPIYYQSYYYCRNDLDLHPLVSGAISGYLSWTLIYPIDTIKTRIQSGQSKSHLEAIKMSQLWVGYRYCAIRAIIANSVGWFSYEIYSELSS